MSEGNIYNTLLFEFDFLVDMDYALYLYIKDNFKNSRYVLKESMNDKLNEYMIRDALLHRKHINPLEYIFKPDIDVTNLYNELMNDKESDVLKYAKAYDTFGLIITFLNEASSIKIDVLCKNQLESDFIKNLNPRVNTIIYENKKSVPINKYTIIYIKYFINCLLYEESMLRGKNIYIANARYNRDEQDEDMYNISASLLFSDLNVIHTMDLFKYIKYKKGRN